MQRPWLGSVYVLYFIVYATATALVADGDTDTAAWLVLATIVSHYALASYVAWKDTAGSAFAERYGGWAARNMALAVLDNGASVTAAGFAVWVLHKADDAATIAYVSIGLAVAVNVFCVYTHCGSAA